MGDKNKYAAGLVGFGSMGNQGPTGQCGLSVYFTDYDGLNPSDEFTLRDRIKNNISLIRTNNEHLLGFENGRRYQTGDYIIDKNSNVYNITLDETMYKFLGFNYAIPNIFYTNDDVNDFGYKKYFNLYYGDDKFLVDNIYTTNFFNKNIYNNSIYGNEIGSYSIVNYVDINNNTPDNKNIQPFAVYATNSNDMHSAFAIVKDNDSFRIGNLDDNNTQRNINLSLDFKTVNIPEKSYLSNGSLILSDYEFNLGVFKESDFIQSPHSMMLEHIPNANDNEKLHFKLHWKIADFFKTPDISNVRGTLKLFKIIDTSNDIINVYSDDKDLILHNIPTDSGDGLAITVPKLLIDTYDKWGYEIEFLDTTTGWTRKSNVRIFSMSSKTNNINIINSRYETVTTKNIRFSVFENETEKQLSNNIAQVSINRCSIIKDKIQNILINTNNINLDNLLPTDKSGVFIICDFTTQNTKYTYKRELTKEELMSTFITLYLHPAEKNTGFIDFSDVENKHQMIEILFTEDDYNNKLPDHSSYTRTIKMRVLNKTNKQLVYDNILKTYEDKSGATHEDLYNDNGGVNELDTWTLNETTEITHNFIESPEFNITLDELSTTTRNLLYRENESTYRSYISKERVNQNPITWDNIYYFNSEYGYDNINNDLKQGFYDFPYTLRMFWKHDVESDRYLKSQELRKNDIIFEYENRSNPSDIITRSYNGPFTQHNIVWAERHYDIISGRSKMESISLNAVDKYGNIAPDFSVYKLKRIGLHLILIYGVTKKAGDYPLTRNFDFTLYESSSKKVLQRKDNLTDTNKHDIKISENYIYDNETTTFENEKPIVYINIESYPDNNIITHNAINSSSTVIHNMFKIKSCNSPDINGHIQIGFSNYTITKLLNNNNWSNVPFINSNQFANLNYVLGIGGYNDKIPISLSGSHENVFTLPSNTFETARLPGKLKYEFENYDKSLINSKSLLQNLNITTYNVVETNIKEFTYVYN